MKDNFLTLRNGVFFTVRVYNAGASAVVGVDLDYVELSSHKSMVITVATFVLVKVLKKNVRTYLSPMLFGNTGNIGLPVCLFAFGTVGFDFAVVVFAVMAIYNFTFGIWIVSGGGSTVKALKEPLIPAVLLGTLFLMNGWQTPEFLTNTLELIGQMAIPLMLLTVGVAIARMNGSELMQVMLPAFGKFIVCLCCALLAVWLFELPKVAGAVLILQVTTPVAVTSYLLAEKYGTDAAEVASLVIISIPAFMTL